MSFKDFITNRLFRKFLAKSFKDWQNLKPPRNPSQRYIAGLVEGILDNDRADRAQRELGMIGRRAVPALLAALRDPRYAQPVQRSHVATGQPLDMVLGLLVPHAPQEVAAAAIPLTQSPSGDVRKLAAIHLASLGREEHLPVLAKLLEDEDGYVRSYVKMGASRAVEEGRCSQEFRKGMYDLLLNQCDQHWEVSGNHAAEGVVQLDPVRAAVDLASERWLSSANENAHRVLQACNRAKVVLPEAAIRRMLDHSLPLAVGEHCCPHEYVVAEALGALVLSIGEAARPLLQAALDSKHDEIREAAAGGLVTLAGIDNPTRFVWTRIEKSGYKSLTEPQRILLLAHMFDVEVCNGGIMQFFGNNSGDHAVETLDALRVIGVPEAETALTKAMELVGPLAREKEQDMRLAAFEGRYEQLQQAFGPLEGAYYKVQGLFRQRVLLYAAKHAEHFRAG